MSVGAWRTTLSVALVLVTAVLTRARAHAQEPPPPQPLSEAQLAQEFKKAAPDLFLEWAATRSEVLQRMGVGSRGINRSACMGNGYWQFLECRVTTPPTEYKLDVTKTDSVLTPFIGHLYIPVNETCTARNVVPKGMSWGEEALAALDPSCLGKVYDA